MKTKHIIALLAATNFITVVIIIIVLSTASRPAESPKAPSDSSEGTSPVINQQIAPEEMKEAPEKLDKEALLKDVLKEADNLYEQTLLEYKKRIYQEPPYWGESIAGYPEAKAGRYPEALEIIQRRLQTSPQDSPRPTSGQSPSTEQVAPELEQMSGSQ